LKSAERQTTIVLPTFGRASVLHETVVGLQAQTTPAREILICPGDEDSLLPETRSLAGVRVIVAAKRGSAPQRNACLDQVSTPYILFLDDDVDLASNYVESMEALFDQRPDVDVADGEMAADGAHTDTGYSHDEGREILARYKPSRLVEALSSATGCCFVRTGIARAVRFDERLPLYGYLEDLDFSTRAKKLGGIVKNGHTALVHLGVPSGRTSGLRLGYSQIVNPVYLWKKSGEPGLGRVLVHFWLRFVVSNMVHSVVRSSKSREDRPGRLRGNLIAFADLLRGRIDPERILSF